MDGTDIGDNSTPVAEEMKRNDETGGNEGSLSDARVEGRGRKRLTRKEHKKRKKQRKAQNKQQAQQEEDGVQGSSATTDSKNSTGNVAESEDIGETAVEYVPTEIPSLKELEKAHGAKPLGKWFPNAVIIKSKDPPVATSKVSLVLFYQYVDPLWPESVTQQLMAYLCQIAQTRVLGGRIRVAREGVNATISSRDSSSGISAVNTIRHFTQDLLQFHDVFKKTDFKFIDDLSGDRHFKDFKVFPVKELVYYGLDGDKAPLHKGGTHLSAQDFHKKLADKDTVVVDVRNHYEAAIGRFDGQTVASTEEKGGTKNKDDAPNAAANGGATYVDPKMRKSTDFANWLNKSETKKQLEGKQVLLYCTGGVRCERASAYLNNNMGEQVAGVYQLQGGIERYLQAYPDGGYWRGKNFVFDKREAIGIDNPDGDGGVVGNKKKHKPSKDKKSEGEFLPEMKCCICQKPWDRYIGKKKCLTCGVPVLMCDACMSSKANKDDQNLIRCPLCIEEDVTVRANEVDWTNNGVAVCKSSEKGKVAPSVLKWGGGHASQKKERRRFKRKLCKFGADCNRPDCFFAHPKGEREGFLAGEND